MLWELSEMSLARDRAEWKRVAMQASLAAASHGGKLTADDINPYSAKNLAEARFANRDSSKLTPYERSYTAALSRVNAAMAKKAAGGGKRGRNRP